MAHFGDGAVVAVGVVVVVGSELHVQVDAMHTETRDVGGQLVVVVVVVVMVVVVLVVGCVYVFV